MKGRRGALGQYHASMSNNRGHDFEEAIRQACLLYANQGRAKVEKTPEPFRVLEKREGGIFVGRFTAHAQPDFQGTLDGGRSIIFEAKYTTTDAMKRDVLTETQMETLERHHRCGALAAVCVGIQDRFFLRTVAGVAGHEGSLWAHERFGGGAGRLPRALHRGGPVPGLCTQDRGPVDNRGRL